MPTAKCYQENGSERGTLDLPADLFGCEVNEPVMHQAVVAYLANQRQGTASSKERGDVKGGGKKPFRQKGTGRARAGTIRSPIYRGGGVVFGPHPRDYRHALPKKLKRLALSSALSSQAKAGAIIVIDELRFSEPKTKRFAELLANLNVLGNKVLFVLDKPVAEILKSARNIAGVKVTQGHMLSTYEVLWADNILVTQSALKAMEEAFRR
ncbi:MAG: 50S ribosomal protein L4 [Candidatus Krumholzibacteria bacterium]|nr:50S ribosomal protein L4 [Candidatus Krumholzibacteria bacterium]